LPGPSSGAQVEDHDHYNFAILKHIRHEGKLSFDDVDLSLGPDFLISVRTGDSVFMDQLRNVSYRSRQIGSTESSI
jgi:hypothetical protein